MTRLSGRTAIVTGAAKGIGRGIARAFAAEGAAVVVSDRDGDSAEAVAGELSAGGARALGIRADVSLEDDVRHLADETLAAFGSIDVLVNNAGIRVNAIAPGPVDTDILADVDEETMAGILAEIPLGRVARVDEIAPVVVLLASEEGAYFTGSVVNVSGGHVM